MDAPGLRETRQAPHRRGLRGPHKDIGLLTWLLRTAAGSASESRRTPLLELDNQLFALELAHWQGTESNEETVRAATLHYLLHARRGERFFGKWSLCGRFTGAASQRAVCRCGELARIFHVTIHIPGVSPRRVVTCPSCDLVEDAPAAWPMDLRRVGPRTIELNGVLPRSGWAAGFNTDTWGTNRYWHWPREADGRPCRRVRIPDEIPNFDRFPTRIELFFFRGFSLARSVAHIPLSAREPIPDPADEQAGVLPTPFGRKETVA